MRPAALLVALAATACAPPSAPAPPSVLLVTFDTTRADRIGAYGHADAQTPTLDALAAEGLRFDAAYTTVPLTTPAHASLLTGLYPSAHGVRSNGDAVVPDAATTLAERFGAHGYRAGAAVSAFVTTRVWNLDQGFEMYRDDVRDSARSRWRSERPADEVADDLIAWLEADDPRPFFAWAHLYDPHQPWPAATPDGVDPYDAEIGFADSQLARMVEAAERAAGASRLVVVVASDHGEALDGEHGERDHGTFLFEETVRVPLVLRLPERLTEPEVVNETVSLIDVAPTLLALADLPPLEGIDGVDLAGVWQRGEARPPVVIESESAAQRFGYHAEVAVVDERWKLMDTPSPRLFDLDTDPAETHNLAAAEPETVARLSAVAEASRGRAPMAASPVDDPDVWDHLAALGYAAAPGASRPSDLDAKDHLDTIRALEEARAALADRDQAEATAARLRALLDAEPQLSEARTTLAMLLRRTGDPEGAEALYREALEAHPSSTVLQSNLASTLVDQGRLEDAIALAGRLHEQVPGDRGARRLMMQVATRAGRLGQARRLGLRFEADDPDDRSVQAELGKVLFAMGRHDEAEARLLRAAAGPVPRPGVHALLGLLARDRAELTQALTHFSVESALAPGDTATRLLLAQTLGAAGLWEDAATEYRALADDGFDTPATRLSWARAVFEVGDYGRSQAVLAPLLPSERPGVQELEAALREALAETDPSAGP